MISFNTFSLLCFIIRCFDKPDQDRSIIERHDKDILPDRAISAWNAEDTELLSNAYWQYRK